MKFIICIFLLLIPLTAVARPYHAPQAVLVANTVDAELIIVGPVEQPQPIPTPKATPKPKPVPKVGCEQYRAVVEKYFGAQTDTALFVASKESGCQNIRSHKQNKNGTWDYCIFQINNEPSALDIDVCIRRAWEKFKPSQSWSQWYAVCAPKTHLPKYPGIKCQ